MVGHRLYFSNMWALPNIETCFGMSPSLLQVILVPKAHVCVTMHLIVE
jgi:hypothetical protein